MRKFMHFSTPWSSAVGRRGCVGGIAAAAALAAAATALAYSGPGTVTHPTGNHVSCQDFGYGGNGVFADQGANGTYNKDYTGATTPVTVTISNYQAGIGQNPATFDWSSTSPIVAVFVKAGSNGSGQNLYTYGPAVSSDSGLESPKPTISHVLFCFTPTAVTVRSFVAARTQGGVALRWRTGTGVESLGFNVYRQVGTHRVRLNRTLISAGTSIRGAGYSWLDRRVVRGQSRYWLQAVSVSGSRSWTASAVVAR